MKKPGKYIVGVFDTYYLKNEIRIVEVVDDIHAVIEVARWKRKEVKHIANKLLNDYKTVEELKKYFLDYWGIGITTPYKSYRGIWDGILR